MDRHDSECMVLARIPDLNSYGSDMPNEPTQKSGSLGVLGARLLNQSLSFKLLSGLAVLLFVVAVLPFFFGGDKTADGTAATLDEADSWHAASVEPESRSPVAESESTPPMTVVSASSERELPPEILPADERLSMSSWPNTARADDSQDAESEKASPIASRPMAVRAAEYQADARSGQASQGQGLNEQDNPNDKPAAGNRYDSTRPSVY